MSFHSGTRLSVFIFFISLTSFLYGQQSSFIQDTVLTDLEKTLVIPPINKDQILKVFYDENGDEIVKVKMPGKPPEVYRASVANIAASAVFIDDVPAYDWSFGCTPTTASMIAGYYDRNGYPYIYTGPTNGGEMPLNNSTWGSVSINGETRKQCPLSASRDGLDGRTTRGHVDDYWIKYGNSGPDPFIVNSWTEHSYGDCLADYMRTSQSAYENTDGSTTMYYFSSGRPISANYTDDGIYGMKLFFEARGYTITQYYTQLIYGYNGNTLGFTFNQFKQEINNGHLVMLQVEGHTMLGYGYDDASNTVYLHDTWDYSSHSMTWGGSYSGMPMWGVSVIHLLSVSNLTINGTGPGNGKVKINNSAPEPLPYSGSFSGPVIIEAVPDSGNFFVGWEGDYNGPQNPVTIQMDMAKNISAEFEPVMNIQVYLPDTAVNIGSSFSLPVMISSYDSVSINSYEFKLIYDPLRLNFTGLDLSGTLTNEQWLIDYNSYEGEIHLAANGPAVTRNGRLINLTFNASDTTYTTRLDFTYFIFNNGNPVASPISGCNIELTQPDICGDIDENGIVQEADASGLLEHVLAITILESEKALRNADADMNGLLQAYDCALILQNVSGITNFVPTCFDPEITAVPSENEEIMVRFPDTVATDGQMKIPVYVTGIQPGDNIISFQFRVTFDDSILYAAGIIDSGSVLPEGWNVMCNSDSPGVIYVAGYGTEPIARDGELLYLKFNVKEINYSSLQVEDFIFNNGNPVVEIRDGSVPVELLSFSALFSDDKVELTWITVTETNNLGFEIERKLDGGNWKKTGFVNGAGNSTVKMNYNYSDMNPGRSGNYIYRLRQIDYDGSFSYSNEVAVKADFIPQAFALYQNYPNPFNPSTMIRYDLPEKSKVRLSVFNILGNEVAVLTNEVQPGGTYQVEFNASSLPSGVYFYRIQAEKYSSIKKFILVK